MRKTVLALALAVSFGAAAIAQAPGSGTTPDPDITKVADTYAKAMLAGDADAIAGSTWRTPWRCLRTSRRSRGAPPSWRTTRSNSPIRP